MADKRVHIISYFTFPVNLADVLSAWPEFDSGEGYAVSLRTENETVETRLIRRDEIEFLEIHGTGEGPVFERALGTIVYCMAAASDNLMVNRHE